VKFHLPLAPSLFKAIICNSVIPGLITSISGGLNMALINVPYCIFYIE
jgi:hypothetical protein